MEGVASFQPFSGRNQRMHYREEGTHHCGSKAFPFYREYIYALEDEIRVYYCFEKTKGELLHTLTFNNSSQCQGVHLCGQDTYYASYEVLDKDRFTLQYDVSGPRKSLTIRTSFSRLRGSEFSRLKAREHERG